LLEGALPVLSKGEDFKQRDRISALLAAAFRLGLEHAM
jgi:hypothetical protein